MDGALCARRPPGDLAITAFAAFFFTGMVAAALWLLATGDPLEKIVGALAFAVGILLVLCSTYQFFKPLPKRFCLAKDAMHFGRAALPLSEIRVARITRRPLCPWLRGTLVELALALESIDGKNLALPLTYQGWERVYGALRARRPELGLPRWQEAPLVLGEMVRGRGSVRLPSCARIVRENFYLGVLAAFFLGFFLLPVILVLFPFPSLGLFSVPLVLLLYHRIVRKLPGCPGGSRAPRRVMIAISRTSRVPFRRRRWYRSFRAPPWPSRASRRTC